MNKTLSTAAAAVALAAAATACSGGGGESQGQGGGDDAIVMGFSQVGAESGWRTANTESIKQAAQDAGIELKFSDAQQQQENQIQAIRNFIQQGVDVIAFSPVVESGWDTVLAEAKSAGIPVVLTDRAVDTDQEDVYETFLGSDFVEEGRKAGRWLVEEYADSDDGVDIVELQGTTGSAPAVDRKEGFTEIISEHDTFEIVASQDGDFTRSGGQEVMQAFLSSHDEIDVLYAHNDDMALGAIESIESAGLEPGEDITVISIDGIKDAFQAMADGKINLVVECNPLIGPQLMDLVEKVHAGEDVEERIKVEEDVYTQDEAEEALPNRKY
ncbi:ABC transporter substrate-binding protein [Streptomonospora salina]|uniref:Simple sugar transport system substrate-binding protein n=1 Tax=Streptomonospora salina TaxID=104205 RepID=A0A841E9S0_9ACTN|nr:ABC transporter substrate-binding protein [Streptomonospora salina]MBB5997260.1 simple sugar transport system substrate-binding protein [Streptomonospora salina]